ncbi:MAG: DNA double-strand break repair nuclease NurA, partial [Chloroflexota bacterium]|nr:DNA double-strand break repair nuclease NurA [Chloroflexota bacterium]
VALAAYVSYPRSAETLNAVRCSLCPNDVNTCTQSCNNRRSAQQPCNNANDFLDRDLFERLLDPGWRSPIYKTNSSVSRDSYDESNKVYFFYVNAGEEIGRVEVPQWVAKSETLLSLTHSLVWDQCRRGQGYPVAISESHEQAVVNTGDRRVFRRMLIDSLEQQGLSGATSQKDRSKRSPWV